MKALKTCATCRHLDIAEEGYEVPGLLDTAYLKTRCPILGWEIKEYYLLPSPSDREPREPLECPFWEYWEGVEKFQEQG